MPSLLWHLSPRTTSPWNLGSLILLALRRVQRIGPLSPLPTILWPGCWWSADEYVVCGNWRLDRTWRSNSPRTYYQASVDNICTETCSQMGVPINGRSTPLELPACANPDGMNVWQGSSLGVQFRGEEASQPRCRSPGKQVFQRESAWLNSL